MLPNKLIEVFIQSQEDLFCDMFGTLSEYYPEKVDLGCDYIYCKGEIPILLVAHLDTVHLKTVCENEIFYDATKRIIWSPMGIGGDDRMGIYGILCLLEKGYRPHVLFTTDEEVGGLGAIGFKNDYKKEELQVKYMIELDRRGNNQCVFYDCENEDFQNYVIDTFKFKKETGTFSDISTLMPHFDIAGVNLSIGYYNEHTSSEYVNLNHFENTIRKVENMLLDDKYNDEYFKGECTNWYDIKSYQKSDLYKQWMKEMDEAEKNYPDMY